MHPASTCVPTPDISKLGKPPPESQRRAGDEPNRPLNEPNETKRTEVFLVKTCVQPRACGTAILNQENDKSSREPHLIPKILDSTGVVVDVHLWKVHLGCQGRPPS